MMSNPSDGCAMHASVHGTIVVTLCMVMLATAIPTFAQSPLRVTKDDSSVSIRTGDRLLVRYLYGGVPFKPYVEQFHSPAGINILRDSPFDHKHHHALMFAVAVDGINFWEEHQAPGRETHRDLTDIRTDRQQGLDRAAFTEHLDWVDPPTKRILVQERRTIEVYQAKELKASLLTWQSRFSLPAGKSTATISGHRYFGLGMRFLKSMDAGGRFVNADGKTGVDGTNLIRSAWCAYTARAGDKPVTVAVFDHPKNFRHPATWYTMDNPFAYLAATLNVKKKPFDITSGKPLTLRYGVALWDGRVDAKSIEKLYQKWVALPISAAPKPTGGHGR